LRRQTKAVVVAALFAFFAFVGSASAGYEELGTFAGNGSGPAGSGSENGQLSDPGQADVNDSSGKLYVADTANNRVEVFKPTSSGGAYDSQVPISAPTGLAIDQATGAVYVASAAGISKYNSTLGPAVGWTDPGVSGTLAVDPSTGDLLVADQGANLIRRFESDGTAAGTFATERPLDVAANSSGKIFVVTSTGNLFSECSATSTIVRYSSAGVAEGTIGSGLVAPGAVAVDPDGNSILVAARVNQYNCGSELIQLAVFDASGAETDLLTLPAATMWSAVPGLAVQGAESGRLYLVLKSPFNDSFGPTKVIAFKVPKPAAPTVVAQSATAGYVEAELRATINPAYEETEYHFEYGKTEGYGQSTPQKQIPAGGVDIAVKVNLSGLEQGATYHYRVVASNSLGTATGADRTFTLSTHLPGNCPNEAIRFLQQSTFLPDCRAYEQVTPVDKNGANLLLGEKSADTPEPLSKAGSVAPSGDQVIFTMSSPLKDAEAAPQYNLVHSLRTTTDWTSRSTASPQAPWSGAGALFSTALAISPTTTLEHSELALTPDSVEGQGNFYLRDAASGKYQLIGAVEHPDDNAANEQEAAVAVGPDYAVFSQRNALTPDAITLPWPQKSLYEYFGGKLHLLSQPGWPVAVDSIVETRAHAVSEDGSRVYFNQSNGGPLALYLSEDGEPGVPISVSHRPADPPTAQTALFLGASADGSVAYFTSNAALTTDVEPGTEYVLYRYTAADGELTAVTPSSLAANPEAESLYGFSVSTPVSDDGSYVYFRSKAVLAPGAEGGVGNIYGWHAGETRLVATLDPPSPNRDPGSQWSVSPDGTKLAFLSTSQLTGYDNSVEGPVCAVTGVEAPRCMEAFLYDWNADELSCASCPELGTPAQGQVALGGLTRLTISGTQILYPQAVLDDGTVFFDTPQQLVPSDTNATRDVYAFEEGEARLISSGRSPAESVFQGVNAGGTDVFFGTQQRLVGQDRDSLVDLYDARIAGGLASQEPQPAPAPCFNAGCQGSPEAPPGAQLGGSGDFNGPGNAKRSKSHRKRCGKKKHGRHKEQQKKAGRSNRRAGACRGGNR
jgi:hypothetical protein